MGVIEVLDADAARRALAVGGLRCPSCESGRLRSWGHARERGVRGLDGIWRVRPDRARCQSCRATHVVLPARLLAHRGYGLDVIGAALAGAARGAGHRTLAARLGAPADTVRSWLRRARANSEALRRVGVQTVVALDQELLPTRVEASPLADALAALAAAGLAAVRRFGGDERDLWPVIALLTRGRLLAPTLAT